MFNSIDLHGCSVSEAKLQLDKYISGLSNNASEVTVIHGYSSSILANFVRKQYKHKRVARKILTMNRGETILVLKK